MQTTGYITVEGETILILVREVKYGRTIKKRATGQKGIHCDNEEYYLTEPEQIHLLNDLRDGKTILL